MRDFISATKTVRRILLGALVLAGHLHAQPFLTNGLVAYYPFNGNANDASGNRNDLITHGATLCPDRFGVSNEAYYFNGSSYLGSAVSPLSQVDNWTISAWIQPGSLAQSTAYAVCVGSDDGSAGAGMAVGISGQGSDGTGFGTSNQFFGFFPGVGYIHADSQFSSTNQWSHVVLLRAAGTLKFFLNGNFVSNNAPTLITPSQPTSFEVGSGGAGAKFFKGAVGDVRIYNRALSSSEVQQLYSYETGPCNPHPATAEATVANGFVIGVTVLDGGCGYTNVPSVQIVDGGGTGATAIAEVTNGVVVGVTITDAGRGYASAPAILISPPACVPYSATAVVTVTNGFVTSATVTDVGCGYTNVPVLELIGGGGTGATATAIVTNGEVIGIMITDAGSGYTNAPEIFVGSPIAPRVALIQAVVPMFTELSIGSLYQLQISVDLVSWESQGTPFVATNNSMTFSQYYPVVGGAQLYFRLATP